MFSALTVEEPSEKLLNAPDITPKVPAAESGALYGVEPSNDPVELYFGTVALLQDCSKIRTAVRHTWQEYSQGRVSLGSCAATTNIVI